MDTSAEKITQIKQTLPVEREKLLVSYYHILAIEVEELSQLPEELQDFSQRLIDYSALGHFELISPMMQNGILPSDEENQAHLLANRLQTTTAQYLSFVDRYQDTYQGKHSLMDLSRDMEMLGKLMADRFDLEDQLITIASRSIPVYSS